MEEQVIYGRWEYPIADDISNEDIFAQYRGRTTRRVDGVSVGGISVCIREGRPRAAIILSYDKECDLIVKLMLVGQKNVQYKDCLKEKLECEAELKRRKDYEKR